MKTTEHFGLSGARTRSTVSRFISTREATGKRKSAAAGRVALTYFDLIVLLQRAHKRLIIGAESYHNDIWPLTLTAATSQQLSPFGQSTGKTGFSLQDFLIYPSTVS